MSDIAIKRIEQAIEEALHPKGMSTHRGQAVVNAHDLQRVLLINAELRKQLEQAEARIDALMLEYCPGDMTTAQIERWAKHQSHAP